MSGRTRTAPSGGSIIYLSQHVNPFIDVLSRFNNIWLWQQSVFLATIKTKEGMLIGLARSIGFTEALAMLECVLARRAWALQQQATEV